jgi:hypothetical protein
MSVHVPPPVEKYRLVAAEAIHWFVDFLANPQYDVILTDINDDDVICGEREQGG